jgi:hypothetical protein
LKIIFNSAEKLSIVSQRIPQEKWIQKILIIFSNYSQLTFCGFGSSLMRVLIVNLNSHKYNSENDKKVSSENPYLHW